MKTKIITKAPNIFLKPYMTEGKVFLKHKIEIPNDYNKTSEYDKIVCALEGILLISSMVYFIPKNDLYNTVEHFLSVLTQVNDKSNKEYILDKKYTDIIIESLNGLHRIMNTVFDEFSYSSSFLSKLGLSAISFYPKKSQGKNFKFSKSLLVSLLSLRKKAVVESPNNAGKQMIGKSSTFYYNNPNNLSILFQHPEFISAIDEDRTYLFKEVVKIFCEKLSIDINVDNVVESLFDSKSPFDGFYAEISKFHNEKKRNRSHKITKNNIYIDDNYLDDKKHNYSFNKALEESYGFITALNAVEGDVHIIPLERPKSCGFKKENDTCINLKYDTSNTKRTLKCFPRFYMVFENKNDAETFNDLIVNNKYTQYSYSLSGRKNSLERLNFQEILMGLEDFHKTSTTLKTPMFLSPRKNPIYGDVYGIMKTNGFVYKEFNNIRPKINEDVINDIMNDASKLLRQLENCGLQDHSVYIMLDQSDTTGLVSQLSNTKTTKTPSYSKFEDSIIHQDTFYKSRSIEYNNSLNRNEFEKKVEELMIKRNIKGLSFEVLFFVLMHHDNDSEKYFKFIKMQRLIDNGINSLEFFPSVTDDDMKNRITEVLKKF